MKKMTVRMATDFIIGAVSCPGYFEYLEVVAFFKPGDCVHTMVCRFRLRDGCSLEDITPGTCIRELIVLKTEGRVYTGIMKGELPEEITRFIRTFDLKLDYPLVVERDSCILHLIGTAEELHTIITAASAKGWRMEILSVEEYDPGISGVFNILTDKQKKILIEAFKAGYFDYPRKVNAEQLAEKMGMHKTTLLEHIHKAEKRLIGHLLAETNL